MMKEVFALSCLGERQGVVATIVVAIGSGHGILVGDIVSLGLESQPHQCVSQYRQWQASQLPEEIVRLHRS